MAIKMSLGYQKLDPLQFYMDVFKDNVYVVMSMIIMAWLCLTTSMHTVWFCASNVTL